MTDSTRTAAQAHISAVVVGFAIIDDALHVGVAKRDAAPLKGRLELPGDFVPPDKITSSAAEIARRTLGIRRAPVQLRSYDAVRRDPRGAVVTVAWWTVLRPEQADESSVQWLAADESGSARMAFDQAKIVDAAAAALREAIRFTAVGAGLCTDTFTMAQLRRVYEVLWKHDLDPANFHRKVTGNPGFVQATDRVSQGGPGRPAQLYVAGDAEELTLPMSRSPRQTG